MPIPALGASDIAPLVLGGLWRIFSERKKYYPAGNVGRQARAKARPDGGGTGDERE